MKMMIVALFIFGALFAVSILFMIDNDGKFGKYFTEQDFKRLERYGVYRNSRIVPAIRHLLDQLDEYEGGVLNAD